MTTAEKMAFEKGLPLNVNAEKLVLGTCLVGHAVPSPVLELSPGDFAIEKHRVISQAILALHGLRRPIEYHTVVEILEARGELEKIGGIAEVAGLTDGMPVLSSIGEYARIVREKSVLRQLAFLGTLFRRRRSTLSRRTASSSKPAPNSRTSKSAIEWTPKSSRSRALIGSTKSTSTTSTSAVSAWGSVGLMS